MTNKINSAGMPTILGTLNKSRFRTNGKLNLKIKSSNTSNNNYKCYFWQNQIMAHNSVLEIKKMIFIGIQIYKK